MTRFLRVLLIGLALLLMGARDLPRPCIGDGLGNPCSIERCECTALCSCKASCSTDVASSPAEPSGASEPSPILSLLQRLSGQDAQGAGEAVAMCSPPGLVTEPESSAQPPATEHSACHMQGADHAEGGLSHFSLPEPPAPVLISAPLSLDTLWDREDVRQPLRPDSLVSRALSPPEPPPRILG